MHGQYLLEITVWLYAWAILTRNNRVAIGMGNINWK